MSETAEELELVPKLRFPEFASLEATMVELRRLAGLVTESAPLSQINPTSYVSTESLLPEFGGFDRPGGLPAVFSVRAYRQNDLLVSNIRPYLKKVWYADRDGGASNDVLVFRAKAATNPSYLAQLIRNDRFISHLMKFAKGVKMPRGDGDDALSFMVFSATEAEQRKIAECLESLEELIAAETEKLEALKRHKKGLLQQLFPAEGETTPRLRFAPFRNAGEWKTVPLGPLTTKVGSGITPTGGSAVYVSSGIPFVRSQNVGWGVFLLEDIAFIDAATHATFQATEIRKSDVLLNITGASIGRSAVADERVESGNVNQHVCIIRTAPSQLSPNYLCQWLNSDMGQQQIDSFQAGGNRQGLNFQQVRSFALPTPGIDEQQFVAKALGCADESKEETQQYLNQLRIHKAALMQQLFPSAEESFDADNR